jgi:hypothetical protein
MSLRLYLEQELDLLQQGQGPFPATVKVSDAQGRQLAITFSQVDQLGCALSELELFVPQLQPAAFQVFQQWAQRLSSKITYLLEQIGPLEFDEPAGQILIRSQPPDQLPDGTEYYEILLSKAGAGTFVLKRYRAVRGQAGRTPVDLLLTRQVLLKLVDDLINTLP